MANRAPTRRQFQVGGDGGAPASTRSAETNAVGVQFACTVPPPKQTANIRAAYDITSAKVKLAWS